MTDYYEEVLVNLVSASPQPRSDLHKRLLEMGFVSEDDFYVLFRTDAARPWQAEELMTLDIKLKGADVYETEDDIAEGSSGHWDVLVVSYLLASLPESHIQRLIDVLDELSSRFGLAIDYESVRVDSDGLLQQLRSAARSLAARQTPAGSEELALEIEEQYA